jgi:hypothetical protein
MTRRFIELEITQGQIINISVINHLSLSLYVWYRFHVTRVRDVSLSRSTFRSIISIDRFLALIYSSLVIADKDRSSSLHRARTTESSSFPLSSLRSLSLSLSLSPMQMRGKGEEE